MEPVEINKAVITVINIIVLGALPWWVYWHLQTRRQLNHMCYDWWIQTIIVMLYSSAICAEIPALWSRWKAYYELKMVMPDSLYILTTWDRWSHLLTYVILMFLTWSITYKRVPKAFTDTFV